MFWIVEMDFPGSLGLWVFQGRCFSCYRIAFQYCYDGIKAIVT